MLTVKGLLWLRAHGLKIAGWLWDHVARIKKLSRGKAQGDYDKKRLVSRGGPKTVNGVRKLISKVGKSFDNLKLFT